MPRLVVVILLACIWVSAGNAAPSRKEVSKPSTIRPASTNAAAWHSLFDGKTLQGMKVTDFAGQGGARVENGQLILQEGIALTGIQWTHAIPHDNYEIELEAMKRDGDDFFCGLTFPVANTNCTLIVGGWGGGVVGISSIDGMDASENATTRYMEFRKNRWYKIRLRVTPVKLETWIDSEKVVDQPIEGRRLGMRAGEIELSIPFGIATWQTTAALKNIRWRPVEGPESNVKSSRP